MRVVLVLLCALSLVGCGRRGPPSPPGPPADITYPHTYPAQ